MRAHLRSLYRARLPSGGTSERRGDLHNSPSKTYLYMWSDLIPVLQSHPKLIKLTVPVQLSYSYITTRECRQVSSIAWLRPCPIRVQSNALTAHWMVIYHDYSHPHAMHGCFQTHHPYRPGSVQWKPIVEDARQCWSWSYLWLA